jgi:hypothetical protein
MLMEKCYHALGIVGRKDWPVYEMRLLIAKGK